MITMKWEYNKQGPGDRKIKILNRKIKILKKFLYVHEKVDKFSRLAFLRGLKTKMITDCYGDETVQVFFNSVPEFDKFLDTLRDVFEWDLYYDRKEVLKHFSNINKKK